MATRVLKVEVKRIGWTKEEDAEARTRLKELCEMVQQATNYVWMTWFSWHLENGSAEKIRVFQEAWIKYKSADASERREMEKPSLDLKAVSNELSNAMYHGIRSQWPALHTRVVVLLLNRLTSLIGAKKASKGSFAGWHAILLYRESVPSSIHPLPIPFDTPKTAGSNNGNAKLMPPEDQESHHRLVVAFSRDENSGQSIKFDCHIWDKGRQMTGRRVALGKIARGEYQMKGSTLCFSRGKVFANITYDIPDTPVELGDGVAFVWPGVTKPLLFRVCDKFDPDEESARWVLGDCRVVAEVRRQLMGQRLGRMASFRQNPTSNSKGHGLHRSLSKVTKLSRRWRDFVVTYSRNLAAAVVSECLRNKVGTVVLRIPGPDTEERDALFLSSSGKGFRESTTWDWYGLEKKINDKCSEAGIRVVADREPAEEKPKRARRKKQGGSE